MIKIAIIGSGGREHALLWKLSKELGRENVYCIPGNGGTWNNVAIDILDFEGIKDFCEKEQIGYIIVGPEVPLMEGITDYFENTAIQVFGPSKHAALLEGSKIYAKDFMDKYQVSTAPFTVFSSVNDAYELIQKMNGDLVIKYDGLAGGKGVFVCDEIKEATNALQSMSDKYGESCDFIIEEKLIGDEISMIGITNGKQIALLSSSQDHKQLFEGDNGPNTGGMGAYCPIDIPDSLWTSIQEGIIKPTLRGLQKEEENYIGFIYFGIMVDADGPRLLEYNCRGGDPETEVILPALKSSLFDLIQASFDGKLSQNLVEYEDGYFADVVIVADGYPSDYPKNMPIIIPDIDEHTLVFHAGTKTNDGDLVSNGGRILNCVAWGNTLEEALERANNCAAAIEIENKYYRKDIGKRENKFIHLCQTNGGA